MGKFSIGEIISAVGRDRVIGSGPEQDLQQHLGLAPNYLPVDVLIVEERAIATVSADTEGNEQPVVPQVFPDGVLAFFGIPTPRVGIGVAAFPVVSTGVATETPAKGASISETTAALTVTSLKPQAIGGAFSFARGCAARARPRRGATRQPEHGARVGAG